MSAGALEVLDPGPQTLVQDLGRPGLAHLGVGASGAFDRAAHALANRLVGNPPEAAALEVTLGGLRLRVTAPTWIAVTGAWGPLALAIDGRERRVEPHTPTPVPAGAELLVGAAEHGVRVTVAVRGGVAVDPVLGSRSRDTLAALGPAPLAAGDRLPLGPEPASPVPAVDVVPVDPPTDARIEFELRPGPRRAWFGPGAWRALFTTEWAASGRSDRTGVRLDGPAIARVRAGELPSEGMVPGAIQVSPDGAPTILGPDAPVTGGYPVIAVVTDATRDRLAQLRPGQPVHFRLATGRD